MLKVSFVVHSTIHLQKMPLVELSVFCIRYFSKTKCKPAKKITGQCFSTELKAACRHSANLERETEITKVVTYPLFPLAFSNGILLDSFLADVSRALLRGIWRTLSISSLMKRYWYALLIR